MKLYKLLKTRILKVQVHNMGCQHTMTVLIFPVHCLKVSLLTLKSFSCLCVYVEFIPKDGIASSMDAHITASVIPSSPDLILPVIDSIVDKFWECRRYGEPWDSNIPPCGFFDDLDDGQSTEAVTLRTHRQLVFDLVAETISEIYRSEEEDHPEAFFIPQLASIRPKPEPPTTLDSLKPRVETQVLRQLGLRDVVPVVVPKWTSNRRKQDAVDWLLVKELGEEEPGWVDYTAGEFDAKTQLVDSLMELMLNDTVQTIQQVMRFRQLTADVES